MSNVSGIVLGSGIEPTKQNKVFTSYPFHDPIFEEGILYITEARGLQNDSPDEAIVKYEEAVSKLQEIARKDYPAVIRIFPPDRKKLEESLRRAEATQIAAGTNIERCIKQIEEIKRVQLVNNTESVNIVAGIIAEVFALDGLQDKSFISDIERVFEKLEITSDNDKQNIVELAKTVAQAAKQYADIALPNDYEVLQKHGVIGNAKYKDKTVSQWTSELIEMLSQPVALPIPSQSSQPVQDQSSIIFQAQTELKDIPLVSIGEEAIALGHPLGASGTRLLTTLLGELEKENEPPIQIGVVGDDGKDEPPISTGGGDDGKDEPLMQTVGIDDVSDSSLPAVNKPIEILLDEIEAGKSLQVINAISLSDIENEIRKYITDKDQAFHFIKILVDKGVISTLAEAEVLAHISSNANLACAANEYDFEQLGLETNTPLLFPQTNGKSTYSACKALYEYIVSGYKNDINSWYAKQLHDEQVKKTAEQGRKINTIVIDDIAPVRNTPLIEQVRGLINRACNEGVISESERAVLDQLILYHIDFERDLKELETKYSEQIVARISDVAEKLKRNYLGLDKRVEEYLLSKKEFKNAPTIEVDSSVENLSRWLNRRNEYFIGCINYEYPGKLNESIDNESVDKEGLSNKTAEQKLKQITISTRGELEAYFPNGHCLERKFIQAYFDLLEVKKLPTVEALSRKLNISKEHFSEFKEKTDQAFIDVGFQPLAIFSKRSYDVASIYFAYKRFVENNPKAPFTFNNLCEAIPQRTAMELCCDLDEKNFSMITSLDPGFKNVLDALQFSALQYEEQRKEGLLELENLMKVLDWQPDAEDIALARNTLVELFSDKDMVCSFGKPDDFVDHVKKLLVNNNQALEDRFLSALGLDEDKLKLVWQYWDIRRDGLEVKFDKLFNAINRENEILTTEEFFAKFIFLDRFCDLDNSNRFGNVFSIDVINGKIDSIDRNILEVYVQEINNQTVEYDKFLNRIASHCDCDAGEVELRLRLEQKRKLTELDYHIIRAYKELAGKKFIAIDPDKLIEQLQQEQHGKINISTSELQSRLNGVINRLFPDIEILKNDITPISDTSRAKIVRISSPYADRLLDALKEHGSLRDNGKLPSVGDLSRAYHNLSPRKRDDLRREFAAVYDGMFQVELSRDDEIVEHVHTTWAGYKGYIDSLNQS